MRVLFHNKSVQAFRSVNLMVSARPHSRFRSELFSAKILFTIVCTLRCIARGKSGTCEEPPPPCPVVPNLLFCFFVLFFGNEGSLKPFSARLAGVCQPASLALLFISHPDHDGGSRGSRVIRICFVAADSFELDTFLENAELFVLWRQKGFRSFFGGGELCDVSKQANWNSAGITV